MLRYVSRACFGKDDLDHALDLKQDNASKSGLANGRAAERDLTPEAAKKKGCWFKLNRAKAK